MSRVTFSDELSCGKLITLAEIEGVGTTDTLISATVIDSVSPGISSRPNCDNTIEVEPDQDQRRCEGCGLQTAASALILAGLI